MKRKTKRRFKPVFNGLRIFGMIALSFIAMLPSFTVKADEIETFGNTHLSFEVDRTDTNEITLSGTSSDESIDILSVTLVSDDGERVIEKAMKDEQGGYKLQFAVGKNGHYKFVVEYSFDGTQAPLLIQYDFEYYLNQDIDPHVSENQDLGTLGEESQEDSDGSAEEVLLDEIESEKKETESGTEESKSGTNETELPWINNRTGEVSYYSEAEIVAFNAEARASGVLTIPDSYLGEYRIDSYSGGWEGTQYSWGIAYINGDYATCLDPTRSPSHGSSYLSESFFDDLPQGQQQRIWLINYFGIGFEGDTNYHRYLAQEEMSWEQMTINQVRGYGGDEKFQISWTGKHGENIALINQYKAEIEPL